MKVRLVALLFLLAFSVEAMACPGCAEDRLLAQNWYTKYIAISLIVPILVVCNRLDFVRLMYVVIPYVAFASKFHNFLLWYGFFNHSFVVDLAWFVWGFNIVGIAMLYVISRFHFFRRNKDKGLAIWQPIAYAAAMFGAQYLIR